MKGIRACGVICVASFADTDRHHSGGSSMAHNGFLIETQPPGIHVRLHEQIIELHPLWLRERSPHPEQLDALTEQRLFNPHQLDPELRLRALRDEGQGRVWLHFSDGHQARYELEALAADFDPHDGIPPMQPWDSTLALQGLRYHWPALADDGQLFEALDGFLRYGALIIDSVPTQADTILEVAARFGHVRETNFGKRFEVYSRADSDDLAYRAVALDPHTDNPYRDPVPGIQLLHCLVNQTRGGQSTLVDSLSAVERLRQADPEGFRLLAGVPVRYRYHGADIELIQRRPIIDTDHDGQVTGVHYSPRLDYSPLLPAAQFGHFHRARQRLGQWFSDPALALRFTLQPGELMLFDNSRVLHGRTAYDPSEGARHLQGCYIDIDAPRGRYRALRRRYQETL
jgi:gamma-butyrobetaine dioxygenase